MWTLLFGNMINGSLIIEVKKYATMHIFNSYLLVFRRIFCSMCCFLVISCSISMHSSHWRLGLDLVFAIKSPLYTMTFKSLRLCLQNSWAVLRRFKGFRFNTGLYAPVDLGMTNAEPRNSHGAFCWHLLWGPTLQAFSLISHPTASKVLEKGKFWHWNYLEISFTSSDTFRKKRINLS